MQHQEAEKSQSKESSQTIIKDLHPRTKDFVELLHKDKKITQTEAYIQTHRTENRNTAKSNASQLLKKPAVAIYRKSLVKEAKQTIVEVMRQAKQTEKIAGLRLAGDMANSIIDRVEGKPTSKLETQNTNLNVNVEASAELGDQFTVFLQQITQPQNN